METPAILEQIPATVTLSPIEHIDPRLLHPNPHNAPFEALKTESYFADLRKAILDVGVILSPLIARRDHCIIAGHSRTKIMCDLLDEGVSVGDGLVPVIFVESEIPVELEKHIMFVDNATRLDTAASKQALAVALWPDFYLAPRKKPGRRSSDAPTPSTTAEEQAALLNISPRQVRRLREASLNALEAVAALETMVDEAGGETDDGSPATVEVIAPALAPEEVLEAGRERLNAKRREKSKRPRTPKEPETPVVVSWQPPTPREAGAPHPSEVPHDDLSPGEARAFGSIQADDNKGRLGWTVDSLPFEMHQDLITLCRAHPDASLAWPELVRWFERSGIIDATARHLILQVIDACSPSSPPPAEDTPTDDGFL